MRLDIVKRSIGQFQPAEKFVFFVTGILVVIDTALLLYKDNATFDAPGYLITLLAALATIAGGLYYHISGRSEPIAQP